MKERRGMRKRRVKKKMLGLISIDRKDGRESCRRLERIRKVKRDVEGDKRNEVKRKQGNRKIKESVRNCYEEEEGKIRVKRKGNERVIAHEGKRERVRIMKRARR